ncbi:unnamed protein product [Didymodactylos carnosus]|uniref:Uncharacterized protein n=1 Tax=Didymodactylos carnosus TaxID=1234261 RepID=A0A814EHJ4_9BILA|nr:unnamed protein product [Didymodactylos carnosus]CAF0967416.1 unnamed protein product [Didymodactylos carnosus]CAF3618209.1 unnamed protein product [Didymodactylos carnosus]CAF3740820.1 unnamed protein product [Didymodactylos carnosus]
MSQTPSQPSPLKAARRTDLRSPELSYLSESSSNDADVRLPLFNTNPPTQTTMNRRKARNSSSSDSDKQATSATIPTIKKKILFNYVDNVLAKHDSEHVQHLHIGGGMKIGSEKINVDASGSDEISDHYFHNEQSRIDGNVFDTGEHSTSFTQHMADGQSEVNFDPDPIVEERESKDQRYKQTVYVRQLQPPTPAPVEIQVQEVLIQPKVQRPPLHVRVASREPRTPSPIIIKSAPPRPPSPVSEQPVIYNKYVPGPKPAPQQVIIHRYPDMPPKPRSIILEQWLPYKPAPKRIIKHSLPREAFLPPPRPRNIIISYSRPRALIEIELIRLPVVKFGVGLRTLTFGELPQLQQFVIVVGYPTDGDNLSVTKDVVS